MLTVGTNNTIRMRHLIEMLISNVILLAAISWLSQSDHDHDNGGVQWKYTSSRIPRFNWDVSKHNPYLYYPPRLLPILGYSDIPLVGGSRLSLLTIIILSHFYWRTQFPVTNPIKHGRNYFVRRLHYAAGEVRSYTLYFPMHRRLKTKLTHHRLGGEDYQDPGGVRRIVYP